MQTADNTTLHTTSTIDGNEARPVRLLVPTTRRGSYYISPEDTMLAANLGITRHTTNNELAHLAHEYDPDRNDPTRGVLAQITAIRDGLAQPRDIDEARAWDLIIPITPHENSEEISDEPTKRLGWWWVYDPTRHETREQRRHRYFADRRLVDTKGLARIWCRAYLSTRDIKVATDTARGVIDDTAGVRARAITRFRNEYPGYPGTDDELIPLLIERAHATVLRGAPLPVDVAGQSDLFTVADAVKTGRVGKKLDEWYVYAKGSPTGRPKGSVTRRWRSPA